MAAARTLQELVAAAASLHPDRPAVKYDSRSGSGIPGSLLLYRDLVQLSGELSLVLRKSCSPNNGAIGLYCGDDLFIPVWILGILQSPAAYVPLDPEAPGLLTARVMDQCGLRYCAVKTDILQRFQASLGEHASVEVLAALPEFRLTLMRITEHRRGPEQTGTTQTADGAGGTAAGLKEARTRDLAYVLHTSGTTGPPKIVRVPHTCILPNILHLRSLFQMSADDVVFLASPLTFDPSVVDMFLALSSGAQLLIIPTVIKKMPRRLAGLLFQDHKTTVLQVTPTLLGRFGRGILKQEVLSSGSSLRVLALGGEACPSPALLRSWRHEDNRTCIWNVYGVTEVSCWASAHRIPDSLLQTSDLMASSVPLGTPLMDTTVEVRDERGDVVTEGEGQVFIGGEDRVCLLDDEETVVSGAMRATGDWVDIKDSQLFYLGRRDRLIKRHGKRVNLDSVQQLISSLPQVEVCAVGLHEASRLLAFVVASRPRVQKSDPPFTSAEQTASAERREDLPSLDGTDADLSRLILNQLSTLLPAHSVPDTLVLVPALSLTHHGKVDMEALFQIYQRRRRRLKSSQGDVTTLKQTLQSLWQETLGLPEDATISEESNFLLSGGDSLKALRLREDILAVTGSTTSPELLEAILDGTFSDVLRHVALTAPSVQSSSVRKHQHTDDSASVVPAKIERTTEPKTPPADSRAVRVIKRAGEVMQISPEERPDLRADDSSGKPGGGGVLGLRLSWSSDTGRCVDASPVLLVHRADPGSGEVKATVFIGSHSHRMQALDLTSGGLLWERVLGGRIEASAAVSRCGSLVVVGCYDGGVYFLCTASGETRWVFETGDAVKCCPAVDPLRGLVMVGSHDGHVYALDPEVRRCVWRQSCGGGAVFSSPYLHASLRQLYAASLGGHLTCLNADSGDVLWSHCRDAAFFSSPNAAAGHVAIGSVDGNICCFRDAGTLVWQFLTEGPVFSSPCVTPDRRSVLCGSHDGHLYCVNVADGSLSWTFQTVGKVYSSPCVIDSSVVGRIGTLVALASTEGTVWILDGQTGKKLASFGLPGELFSSPVVFGRSLVVGCRNDYVYCLELTVEEDVRFLE